jgi:hypothetical protein
MEIKVDIKSTGIESAIIYAPFDRALTEFQKNDYKLISLPQNAELRIQQGKDHYVSKNGNWVKEGALYVPRKGRFITRHFTVLDDPRKATQAHKKEKEYFVPGEQVEMALEDSVHVPYDVNEIPTDRFGENAIAMFCFGKNAKDYGLFLKDVGISNMPLWFNEEDYVQEQEKPYANQLWLGRLDFRSGLYGYCKGLDYYVRSRGVK